MCRYLWRNRNSSRRNVKFVCRGQAICQAAPAAIGITWSDLWKNMLVKQKPKLVVVLMIVVMFTIPGPIRQELARTMADNTSNFQSCLWSFNLCSANDNRFCTFQNINSQQSVVFDVIRSLLPGTNNNDLALEPQFQHNLFEPNSLKKS